MFSHRNWEKRWEKHMEKLKKQFVFEDSFFYDFANISLIVSNSAIPYFFEAARTLNFKVDEIKFDARLLEKNFNAMKFDQYLEMIKLFVSYFLCVLGEKEWEAISRGRDKGEVEHAVLTSLSFTEEDFKRHIDDKLIFGVNYNRYSIMNVREMMKIIGLEEMTNNDILVSLMERSRDEMCGYLIDSLISLN